MPITSLPTPPNRTDGHAEFVSRANAHVAALSLFTSEATALEENVNTKEANAVASGNMATASANFKGSWPALAGPAATPFSVHYDDNYWMLAEDIADVTLFEPGVSDKWILIGLGIPIVANEAALGTGILNGQSAITADTGNRWVWVAATEIWKEIGGVPVGVTIIWEGDTPPDGYLEKDGSAISRTAYADLFALHGTRFGAGDGVNTFNIKDSRGYFIRGWDHGAGIDPDAATRTDRGDGVTGDSVGTNQSDAIASHSHTYPLGVGSASGPYQKMREYNDDFNTFKSTNVSGGNESRPRNSYVMFCIKY